MGGWVWWVRAGAWGVLPACSTVTLGKDLEAQGWTQMGDMPPVLPEWSALSSRRNGPRGTSL